MAENRRKRWQNHSAEGSRTSHETSTPQPACIAAVTQNTFHKLHACVVRKKKDKARFKDQQNPGSDTTAAACVIEVKLGTWPAVVDLDEVCPALHDFCAFPEKGGDSRYMPCPQRWHMVLLRQEMSCTCMHRLCNVKVKVDNLLATSHRDFGNSGEPGSQAIAVDHL